MPDRLDSFQPKVMEKVLRRLIVRWVAAGATVPTQAASDDPLARYALDHQRAPRRRLGRDLKRAAHPRDFTLR